MKRLWIPLKKTEIFDHMHWMQDGNLVVDEEKDGQSLEKHLEDIKYIKQVLEEGKKVRPILVRDNEDGTYTRLDGFKRCMAHIELGYPLIEAFVCSQEEYRRSEIYPYANHEIRCWHGGQEKEHLGLFEEGAENMSYEDTIFLYKSESANGLRIEVAECIHVHWGDCGKYRLALGRKDFEELAKAIISING